MKRRVAIALATVIVVAAMGGGSAQAAAPAFGVNGFHTPTHFAPGSTGRYAFVVQNMGDAATSGPASLDIALPTGVTTRLNPLNGATVSGPLEFLWDCGAGTSTAGSSSLSCSLTRPLRAGEIQAIVVEVSVALGAAGDLAAQATVSGGGAGTRIAREAALVGPNDAGFGIAPGTFEADAFDAAGDPERQAGAHPFQAKATFAFTSRYAADLDLGGNPVTVPVPAGSVRNIDVTLPRGLVGNPLAAAQCQADAVLTQVYSGTASCPVDSQIGTVFLALHHTFLGPQVLNPTQYALYNLEPPKGALADFGFAYVARPVHILAKLDPRDNSVVTQVRDINESVGFPAQSLTVWGVPADPAHDGSRFDPHSSNLYNLGPASSAAPRRPFLTMPSQCGVDDTTDITMSSWQAPQAWTEKVSSAAARVTGCDKLSFVPSIDLTPDTTAPDSPTGLKVDIDLPQDATPDGLGTPPLRTVKVTLPEGMTINPAAADGLEACTDAQLGLKTNSKVTCPNGSKIGAVTASSPALEGQLEGSVYVRAQNSGDPESGEMFRMALVVENEDRGILVKLPGSIKADPQTGRLETVVEDNPQLPVSRIGVRFFGGPRAPLATPPTCGSKSIESTLTSWGGQVHQESDSFDVTCPSFDGFSPSFAAGPTRPAGGAFSPFVVRIDRKDGDQYLDGVSVELPTGATARLKGVPRCADDRAAAGTCGVESRIGSATVGAGAGTNPFFLEDQPVYLAGPYKGAPFSLSVVTRAVAGPFDLGTVVVRQALYVDPADAHITVVSDKLPTIVKGVPLRLRSVNVDVDRPGFTLNPTSCAEKTATGRFGSQQGASATRTVTLRVGGCRVLALKPKLKLALTGSSQLTDGRHPGLKATLTQGAGQAGIRRAAVKLPLSLALDPNNAESDTLCSFDESVKPDPKCPASSIVGTAKAWTPLLDRPLEGPVYFSKNVRVDAKSGRRIRALPKLVIALRGEVALNLVGTSSTSRDGKLINTFATVPDAPVSRFELSLKGGKKGILVVNGNACKRSRVAVVEIDGHNNKQADQAPKMSAPCAKAARAARKARARQRAATARARQRAAARAHSRR